MLNLKTALLLGALLLCGNGALQAAASAPAADTPAKPELLVFDGGGDADLYGNTVLGLAGRYYRFDLFRPLLNDFHRSVQEGLYTDVFFLVLENAVFRRGAQERPILPDLRAAYARTLLRDTPPAEGMTDGALRRAWAQQVLGQPCDKALVPVLADIAENG